MRPQPVDVALVQAELRELLESVNDGTLWQDAFFADVPVEKRVLRDIAFSGDAEPTSSPSFLAVVQVAADLKMSMGLDGVKLVLITNATLLTRELVKRGLAIILANQGEIWAKFDAGTEAYYQVVNQAVIPYSRILDNILQAGKKQPIVIQTMVASIDGIAFPKTEQLAYTKQLSLLIDQGCQITRVQLYTVARAPGESNLPENCAVQAVENADLNAFKSIINSDLPQIHVDLY